MIDFPLWWLTKDGDTALLEMYERHYSSYKYADGRQRNQCIGPGEVIALRTFDGDAFFVWRKFIDDCIDERTGERQQGVNCAMFRNEGRYQSSELIRQADRIADFCWPGERHYTYVNSQKIRSTNPGFCFLRAGWRRLEQKTKSGLTILERVIE